MNISHTNIQYRQQLAAIFFPKRTLGFHPYACEQKWIIWISSEKFFFFHRRLDETFFTCQQKKNVQYYYSTSLKWIHLHGFNIFARKCAFKLHNSKSFRAANIDFGEITSTKMIIGKTQIICLLAKIKSFDNVSNFTVIVRIYD